MNLTLISFETNLTCECCVDVQLRYRNLTANGTREIVNDERTKREKKKEDDRKLTSEIGHQTVYKTFDF